jgi:hypothetical protein
MHELSPAARLAAWGGAALAGHVSLDDAADVIAGSGDAAHRFFGLAGEEGGVNVAYALGKLRAQGAQGLRLVLPRPGDNGGLPGPAEFNDRALSRGEAVLTVGGPPRGVLREGRGAWTVHDVSPDPRTPMSLREAEWALTEQMREATAVLVQLDVARWEPVAAEVLQHPARNAAAPALPLTSPTQAQHVVEWALRMMTIVEVARQSDGAAVTSAEADARLQVLRDLDTAARHGLEAACSTQLR